MTPRERQLAASLRDAEARIPQLQLEKIAADTAKDQAEASLRNAQVEVVIVSENLGGLLDVVEAEDYTLLPPNVQAKLQELDPDRFPLP